MKFTRADLDGASISERRVIAQRLAARLGSNFVGEEPCGAFDLPSLRHLPTQLSFMFVPSGSFIMGFSASDEAELERELDIDDEEVGPICSELRACAAPAHRVDVAAFLLARAPLLHRHARQLLGNYADAAAPFFAFDAFDPALPAVLLPDECGVVCAHSGFRPPSEAEWEYVAREFGTRNFNCAEAEAETAAVFRRAPFSEQATAPAINSLGVWGLQLGEWVADGWHDNYDGAPGTSQSWQPPAVPETYRGSAARSYPWQSPGEVIGAHPASRFRASPDVSSLCLRLALSVPGED